MVRNSVLYRTVPYRAMEIHKFFTAPPRTARACYRPSYLHHEWPLPTVITVERVNVLRLNKGSIPEL